MNEEAKQEEFVKRENKKNIFICQEMEQSDIRRNHVEKLGAESWRNNESDLESESRGDFEPDSLNYDEASHNQELSNRDGDFDEYEDGYDEAEYDEAEYDEAEYDEAEYDDDYDDDDDEYEDIADEVVEDHECQNSSDEDEHWYNGPVSGEYVWQPYSEDDNTKGEYVWKPTEKTTEPYWGNRKKQEEWIPQEVKKKRKKGWKPRLIASKEVGKTVWYYKLPSTSITPAAQRKSLKHISQLIKDKGNQRWFSQMVSTKDKKKKTVWYCKLTPVDAEQQVNGTDAGSTIVTETMDNLQINEARTIKENPKEFQQVDERIETGSNEEKQQRIHQNLENHKVITQAGQKDPTKTQNSAMVTLKMEETPTKLESPINPDPKAAVKKPNLQTHENTIPKMIQIQIWSKKPVEKDREVLLPSDPKEQAKGRWLPKLGKTHKDMCTALSDEESQKENPKESFLGHVPKKTKSHIDDRPKKATAIWYEDTTKD